MGCISVSTGIHTKHSRDLKITALKPILVQWRSWSREYICSKGRITWIDESQVVGANLMFLFFFLSLPRWNFCHENRKENVSLIKLGVRLLQEQTQRKSPVYKYSFRHLCMRAYYKKKNMKQFQPVYILIMGVLCTLATSHRSSQAAEGHIFERANYNTRKTCRH